MKIKFTAPTKAFPFFNNVKIETKDGWKMIIANPTDGRSSGPALFPNKEEMIAGIKKAVKNG